MNLLFKFIPNSFEIVAERVIYQNMISLLDVIMIYASYIVLFYRFYLFNFQMEPTTTTSATCILPTALPLCLWSLSFFPGISRKFNPYYNLQQILKGILKIKFFSAILSLSFSDAIQFFDEFIFNYMYLEYLLRTMFASNLIWFDY